MKSRAIGWAAVFGAALLTGAAGCRGARIQPAEPRCDNPCPPVVTRAATPCAPPCAPTGGIPASVEWDESVSPAVDCNPVMTQHTIVVTVKDACGHPLAGQRVEWILARHQTAVGDIVAVDDQYGVGAIAPLSGNGYAATNNGNKFGNQYAVSVTNFEDELIDAANNYPYTDPTGNRMPDIRIGRGQSYLTVTSVVEGVTDIIAYVPGIKDGSKHKIFAKKIWADYEVTYPQDATNLLPNATHTFTVNVHKASNPRAGIGQIAVEAEVLDGPDASFGAGGGSGRTAQLMSGPDGNATFTLHNTSGVNGTNRVRFTTRGRFFDAECPRSQIVKKVWQKVTLECRCALSAATVDVNDTVDATYTITNTGDATAENVMLAVNPPAGLQIADGTTFPVSMGPVAAGATVQKVIKFKAITEGVQPIGWSATSPSGGASSACACQVEVLRGKLEITCRCEPGTVDVGQPIQIVGTIANTGRGTVRNVVLTLVWPEGITPGSQNVVTLPELPAGRAAPDQFIFQGTPTRPGKFPTVVRATADGFAEVTSGCECAAVQCALAVQMICPGRLGYGEPGNFTVKVTNTGDGAANDVVVHVTHGACLDGGVQDFQMGTIPAGQSVAHDWVARGVANSKCTIVAEAMGAGCAARGECEIEVTGLPAIQTEMSDKDTNHVEKGIFVVGEEFLYVLEVQNDVATEATPPLKVVLTLPPELQFVSATAQRGVSVSGAGQTATSTDFRLDLNEKILLEFRVKVLSVPPGNLVTATASIQRASDGAPLASETESTTVK